MVNSVKGYFYCSNPVAVEITRTTAKATINTGFKDIIEHTTIIVVEGTIHCFRLSFLNN